ncbi:MULTISPECIES: ParA family protein [Burkholderia cepacia complex]|uniref:ParA family protein n=1 Tax=Burkholderia cepacia complex TaxID=87882 RepID=UPI000CFE8843|nr:MULTISPECIES: AAA family ATPase [Burkholderia cepacia complex]MBY4796571.1 ParA family protein [Burkholderia multivorans]PRE62678.1 phosphopantetheine--protein transferase [Burkholderia multivorans]PRG26909.1 phosphopantetheine--protein transferase [Burkholderia multivorans]
MDMTTLLPPGKTTAADLMQLAQLSDVMLQKIRDEMLEPFPRKVPPPISSTRLQEMCGIDKQRMAYVLKKGELPPGTQSKPGAPRAFTVEDTIAWVKASLKPVQRKGPAKVIVVANFKGGVTKTTTSTLLSQGLAMRRGRRVLHIDLDPQGSATTLYGINPHAEVDASQTIMPLIEAYLSDQPFDMTQLPVPSYWPNVDIIPSSTELFNAEFMLPARASATDQGVRFEQVLHDGLEQLKDAYDYIIIDTAPTLSYLTINAVFAADGVIVPVVPDMLSFASMVQFWHLFADLINGMKAFGDERSKEFDFVDVLVTRMTSKPAAQILQGWITQIYGSRVLPIEIPETDLARNTNMRFSTFYDLANSDVGAETLRRIRNPVDQLVDRVDDKVSASWSRGS